MRPILAIALKDLRLLSRNKATMFFTFIWPILMAVGFGLKFGGFGDKAKMRVLIDDQDQSVASQSFIDALIALDSMQIEMASRNMAQVAVKRGQAVALVEIPKGFGIARTRLFFGESAEVRVLIDPSRKAELGMLQGLLMQIASEDMGDRIGKLGSDNEWLNSARADVGALPEAERARYDSLFDALSALPSTQNTTSKSANSSAGWQPLKVTTETIEVQRSGPRNPFAVTFPQGMLWGLVGCLMGFASGFAQEREKGTWLRLRTGPLTTMQLMLGKALAALIALLLVQIILLLMARLLFGLVPISFAALALVVLASALAFTGLMLLISSAGRTVQGVSSAGWASLMPLMMIGGGMIPLIAMPAWMAQVSALSPVNWALRSLEGAIWRGYEWSDYLWPLSALALLGVISFAIGARRLARMHD